VFVCGGRGPEASFLSCQRCLLAKQVLLKEHKKVEGELRFGEWEMVDGSKDKGNPSQPAFRHR